MVLSVFSRARATRGRLPSLPISSRRPSAARSRIPAISSRDGKEARTPFRATEIEAASVAAATASLQPRPRALAAIKTPQNTSPAPDRVDRRSPWAPTRETYRRPRRKRRLRRRASERPRLRPSCKASRAASSASPPASSIASPRLTKTRSTERPVVVPSRICWRRIENCRRAFRLRQRETVARDARPQIALHDDEVSRPIHDSIGVSAIGSKFRAASMRLRIVFSP